MLDTRPMLMVSNFPAIHRDELETLQVNLGYKCNLSCTHCHVAAGPTRTEVMSGEVIEDILNFLRARPVGTLDLTGGAPEMNPHFRYLVKQARALGIKVIDRCNLTILLEQEYEDLAQFLADQRVEVVASLPCYAEQNVDKQRGKGVYQESINALKKLNTLGYGQQDSGLTLNLVFNPGGPSLPPPQGPLERDYKEQLFATHGIVFNSLFALTNMPISRFGSFLLSKGEFNNYMGLLKNAYCEDNLTGLMCKNLISIDWQGYVYDCDFNQMLDIPMIASDKPKTHLRELTTVQLKGKPIRVADHCYGCAAGQGSSCGGALD